MYFYQEPSGLVVHWRCYKNSSDLVDRPTGGASPELPPAGFGARGFTQSSCYYQPTVPHIFQLGAIHEKVIHTKTNLKRLSNETHLLCAVLCTEPLSSISSFVSAKAWTRGLGACLTSSFVSSALSSQASSSHNQRSLGSCLGFQIWFVKSDQKKQIGRQWHCPLIPSLIFPFLTFHYLWHRVPLNICPVPTSPWWYIIVVLMKLQLGFHQDVFLCFCDQETAARFPIWSSTLHQFSPVNIQFSGTCPLNNYYLLYFSINACTI